jgi:elongation factor G
MAKSNPLDLRNLALCGHLGAGKTILAEAMLMNSGVINRIGSIADGTTFSDYDQEEKERKYSVNVTPLHCTYNDIEFNVIDTPGGIDFFGAQIAGMAASGIVVTCINASEGVDAIARKVWTTADKMVRAHAIVITNMDGDNVSYSEVLGNIREVFGKKCIPFTIAKGEGKSFEGVVSVFDKDIPADLADIDEIRRTEIIECAIEADDDLMEKYLEEGEISDEDIHNVMPLAIRKGTVIPVFPVSAVNNIGVKEFMDNIVEYFPSPVCMDIKAHKVDGDELVEVKATPSADKPFLAQIFKTVSDPHVGKLCFARVWKGKISAKDTIEIGRTGKKEKVSHIYRYSGAQNSELNEAVAGDIVVFAKIDSLHTGDTIYAPGNPLRLPEIPFPKPMVGLAVTPKDSGDEQKISGALAKLSDEDPTFETGMDVQTHELVIHGMGQKHLDLMLSRLAKRYKVNVDTKTPKIPYLETIGAKAEGHHRHKKQSGGAGQFAEVYLRVWPKERGEGFEFINSIVGGAISTPFVGSTEKGVVAAMEKGPMAGYPVVDIAVEVYDGKEHPVDSKDIAFQSAGKHALHDAMNNAKPCLLEPIVDMEIVFPSQYTGDINGDISVRRGRPTGMEMVGDMQMLKAEAPLAEVADYGSTLKAITQGEGFFSMELSHYAKVPGNIASQVIEKLKAEQAAG